MKKIVRIVLGLILVLAMTAGCTSNQAVLTVENDQATTGEATFVLRELEAMYESYYGSDIWEAGQGGETYSEIAKEAAIDSLSRLYVSNIVAQEKGIALTEDELAEVDQLMTDYLTYTTEEALNEDGVTLEDVKKVFTLNAVGEKLMDYELSDFIVDEEALNQSLESDSSYQQIQAFGYDGVLEQVKVKHILISTLNEDGTEMSDDQKSAAKTKAEEVYQKALDGEAFDGLVADYSDDSTWTENGGEYTFYRSDETFVEASFDMEIGEIRLVESDLGYHIVEKLEHTYPDEEQVQNVKDYEAYLIQTHSDSQKQTAYDALFDEWTGNYTVTINDSAVEKIKTTYELSLENSH